MKKIFRYLILACMFLMLVACGKKDSEKAFDEKVKEVKTDLIKREEKSVEPFKTILKIYEKTTYKINKVEENGDNAQLDVTIKAVNLEKYMDELSTHLQATASVELTEEEINQKAIDYFTELLKNEKNLEFTETNIQVQMQKISGKWNILNTDDIYTAITSNPVSVEIVP